MMIKRGEYDASKKSFRQVSYGDYLERNPQKAFGDAVGVIVAAGEITEGQGGPGVVGGLSTANMIRRAREDDASRPWCCASIRPAAAPTARN
jgi:protease-4